MNSLIQLFIFSLLIFLQLSNIVDLHRISRQSCNNQFRSKIVRVTGDWSIDAGSSSIWNGAEPKGLMEFDEEKCIYFVIINNLKSNFQYNWKITIDNSWSTDFGCKGLKGPNCVMRSDNEGYVRFVVKPNVNPPQLLTDYDIDKTKMTTVTTKATTTTKAACVNNFASKSLRVTGDWAENAGSVSNWNEAEPLGLLEFDLVDCAYYLVLSTLLPNKEYKWKVTVDESWKNNYGCQGFKAGDCTMKSDVDGHVRFIVKPIGNSLVLSTDFGMDKSQITTRASTTPGSSTLPPKCKDTFASNVIRATGDWSLEAGGSKIWNEKEPNGLMVLNEDECVYAVVILGLKPNEQYHWKAVLDGNWKINYGCNGNANCVFRTNAAGAIRLVFKPTLPPVLTADTKVAKCGNGVCDPGQSCEDCPQDCGECPPPVCGDGVCNRGKTFQTCPQDCPNELPNCERFNDESCRSGSQFNANPGVEKRRWQTPKPGSKKYQKSFQNFHALVGYTDIRYTSTRRDAADVCIVATHKNNVQLKYFFNGIEQSENCKRFDSSYTDLVSLKVVGTDETELNLAAVDLMWNAKPLKNRGNDAVYRNGQKGAVVELFGWPHRDIAKECEIIAKAGYLGVKLFPVHEQLMSSQPFNGIMNPWYFMYQPVSYTLDGRMGTREELREMISTCRSHGLRVYVDAVLNHFTGAGNDLNNHRNPNAGCTKWSNKTSSAPVERQSPFYTHAFTYEYNENTGEPPSQEFPGAALGPEDFHCERSLGSWADIFILNNGWLVGLTDIDTSKPNVQERQAAYLIEMMSMGVSGFRIDAAKHMSVEDLSDIFKRVQTKLGGKLPDDFIFWLEVLTGGEAGILWQGVAEYGSKFEALLLKKLGSMEEVNKVKMWDGLYPKEPQNNPISRHRVVIQNDDHDQQSHGSSSRDMGPTGCVLVKNCPVDQHRNFEIKLFQSPFFINDNSNDWPIRFILSSYYHTDGSDGVPDGKSSCDLCKVTCETCKDSATYKPAYVPDACAYKGDSYTRVHRDLPIINAMRSWMGLAPTSGSNIGLPNC